MVWPILNLGEICGFQNGFAFKSKLFTESGIPVLRISNIQGGSIDLSKIVYTDPKSYKEELGRYHVGDGDLLIAMSGATTGKIGVNSTGLSFLLNQRVGKFLPSNKLDKQYLYYYLTTKVEKHLEISAGAAQPNLSTEQIKAIKIPLPSLLEQKRIVAILDQVFADIEKARAIAEANLKNARELFDSYLQQVFSQRGEGWIDKPLDEICDFSSGGTPSKKNDRFWDGDIPWVSGRDMKTTQLFDSFLHISEVAIEESAARTAPVGTILCLVRGMGLAHGAQIAELMVPCAFNQDIKGIHPKPEIVSRYLVFVLRHRIDSTSYVLSSAAHGTLKINMEQLKELTIPVPSEHQQKEIVKNLDMLISDINALKSVYLKKLNKLDELNKSILQKAFTGELTKKKVEVA